MTIEKNTRNRMAVMLSAFAFLFLMGAGCGQAEAPVVDPVEDEVADEVAADETNTEETTEAAVPTVEETTTAPEVSVEIVEEAPAEAVVEEAAEATEAVEEAAPTAEATPVDTQALAEEVEALRNLDTQVEDLAPQQENADAPAEAILEAAPVAEDLAIEDAVTAPSAVEPGATLGDGLPDGAYTLDMANSAVRWEGTKIGGAHQGTIGIQSGEATIEGDTIMSGSFVIDMNRIKNMDNDGSSSQGLVDHLKRDDFFNVAMYPTATFAVNAITGGEATGNLTMHGQTHPITMPVNVTKEENGFHVTGMITLDRTKWGMQKSLVVKNEISVWIDVMLVPGA